MRRESFTSHSLDTFGRQTLKSIIVDEGGGGGRGEVIGRLEAEGVELPRIDLELCCSEILDLSLFFGENLIYNFFFLLICLFHLCEKPSPRCALWLQGGRQT